MNGRHRGTRGTVPRVQIACDAEIIGTGSRRELPFVLGVLADLSGRPEPPLPRLRDRKFVEVDRSTIDKLMTAARPRLAMRVENRLSGDDTKLSVELRPSVLEDFAPEAIARQLSPLRKLTELRAEMTSLLRLLGEPRG